MVNITTKLLDIVLTSDFFPGFYAVEPEKHAKIVGFLSELLIIVKNLPPEPKYEVSKTLKVNDVGKQSYLFLHRLMSETPQPEYAHIHRDMLLCHLELMYFAFRRDLDYAKEAFQTADAADLIDKILQFPDNSTFIFGF